MAKNPKIPPIKSDEEYQFTEAETPLVEPLPKPPRNALAFLKNRKFLALIGVVIAVALVYQFLTPSPIKDEPVPAVTTVTPSISVTPPAAKTVSVSPPVPSVNVVEPASAVQVEQFAALNRQLQQQQQQLQQLQMTTQQLQGAMAQLSSQLNTLQKLATVPPAPPVVAKPAVPKKGVKKAAPLPVYQIRALVPGRAWLQLKNNRQIVKQVTVKVGDVLPGYGVIQAINPAQGKIWTSSGRVISLSEN